MKQLRQKIDGIDRQILRLLARRKKVVMQITRTKKQKGMKPVDVLRERIIKRSLAAQAKALGLPVPLVLRLFNLILAESRRLQRSLI